MSVVNIRCQEEFDEALKGDKLVVVDFTATWCGPCQRVKPVFKQLAEDNADVVFLAVDVDEAADIAERCDVQAMPTFHFYKGGDKVEVFEGADVQKLTDTIARLK